VFIVHNEYHFSGMAGEWVDIWREPASEEVSPEASVKERETATEAVNDSRHELQQPRELGQRRWKETFFRKKFVLGF